MEKINHFFELTRLKKPIGYMLLFWPCVWGLTVAFDFSNNVQIYLKYIFLFFSGSILMRSAGCIINDIADKDFDARVARTKKRPIAFGKVSVKHLIVGKSGNVSGDISGETAWIEGVVDESLNLSGKLTVASTGKIRGKISYGSIEAHEGAKLVGEISTDWDAPSASSQADRIGRLAQKVEPRPSPSASENSEDD